MNLDRYFRRIGFEGEEAPTPDTLAAIARLHAMAIPFENLAVLSTGAPDLDLATLEDKLVARRRGGYCYEQNGLLLAALRALGFRAHGLSARVRYGIPADVPTPRSHMLVLVESDDATVFVDAGFGGLTLTAPVRLNWHEVQATPHERVRLVPADGDHLLQAEVGGAWVDVYRFDLARQLPVDYVQQNWHTATRPNALFGNNVVVTLPTAEGRWSLFNRTLTWRTKNGTKERTELASRTELNHALERVFGLALPATEIDTAWEVSGRGQSVSPAFS